MFAELSKLTNNPEALLIIASLVTGVLIVGLLAWWIYKLKHPSDEQLLEKTLKQNSLAVEKGVIFSDGLYGYHFIDFLVLFPKNIMILGVQHGEGYIFGGENMEQWAQVLNQKSYKFDNPLNRVNLYVHTVNGMVDSTDIIIGRVVFTGNNSFPKGVPEGVLDKETLVECLRDVQGKQVTDSEEVRQTWDKLLHISKDHRQQYRRDS
jgi:hypothetical protein